MTATKAAPSTSPRQAFLCELQRLLYHDVFHKTVLRRLRAWFPLLPMGGGGPSGCAEGQGAFSSTSADAYVAAASRASPPRVDAASHDSRQYLHERAEAWAERWVPSVFFGSGIDN
eukprot:7115059-Pyramimonas_sp.AAC.2